MSEKHPPATREDHDDFCVTEQWELVRGASGQPVKHHRTYELSLPDRRILRTRISKPINTSTYGASLWGHILRDQLEVTADVFWACVNDDVLPDRGDSISAPPADAIPLGVLTQLKRIGVSDDELAAMTKDEAIAKLDEHWAAGGA